MSRSRSYQVGEEIPVDSPDFRVAVQLAAKEINETEDQIWARIAKIEWTPQSPDVDWDVELFRCYFRQCLGRAVKILDGQPEDQPTNDTAYNAEKERIIFRGAIYLLAKDLGLPTDPIERQAYDLENQTALFQAYFRFCRVKSTWIHAYQWAEICRVCGIKDETK